MTVIIASEAYWRGRDVAYADELTPDLRVNASITLARVNALRIKYEKMTGKIAPAGVTSGWRPKSVNDATPGAAKGSKHLTCEAIDLDDNGPFDRWCFEHPEELAAAGLWQEHPGWTDGWCHLQTVPPRSGAHIRVFIPSQNEPMTMAYGDRPVIWNPA